MSHPLATVAGDVVLPAADTSEVVTAIVAGDPGPFRIRRTPLRGLARHTF
jgi:hypothetical protein